MAGAHRRWLAGGGIFTALALLVSMAVAWTWLTEGTETRGFAYTHPGGRVSIDAEVGDLKVVAGPPGRVTMERELNWTVRRPATREFWDGTTLQLRTGCRKWLLPGGCRVSYVLHVPPGTELEARTSAGDIVVRDMTAGLRLSALSGDLDVANPHGALSLSTLSGEVTATGVRSPQVTARATSGNITLEWTAPPTSVDARTTDGNVEVTVPGGRNYAVDAATQNGRPTVSVASDPTAPARLLVHTTNGNVDVDYTRA